ncbi:hypothetical protein A2Z00_00570 [Candidatus Gottesmanbacteria bacterium RBG_13_45_10]|uniref:Mannosyl-glycoprotein endo-beta-N-acetylglucosamidase-like domain-containing protein n=1 Tax=Candidatus Gottesmanbacteria bacterium RBG_13_45_10 TaxID=1798370 RepID=A0A1F5ZFX9_9BACT|nr:MAG: hypothetical protein A2Z00_00570 [Candidatus Gottesmanbacteria bacterium RBG_13_45_10]
MFRKSLLVLAWFPLTYILLIINLTLLASYTQTRANGTKLSTYPPEETPFQLTASAGTSQVLSATVTAGDARVLLVKSFLEKYNSPMSDIADAIVAEADRYGVDFRLVPAIAMCESNAGKRIPKKNEYNAFGIAVYTGQLKGKAFADWQQSIEWVTKYIKEKYYDRGITDLRDIGAIWAPPSVNTQYSWTTCVERFRNSII